jgi:hypothetical protein
MSNRIRIETKDCATGTRAVYRGEQLIATIHKGKPTAANGRQAEYSLCRVSGRVDWFDSYAQARDEALKG